MILYGPRGLQHSPESWESWKFKSPLFPESFIEVVVVVVVDVVVVVLFVVGLGLGVGFCVVFSTFVLEFDPLL